MRISRLNIMLFIIPTLITTHFLNKDNVPLNIIIGIDLVVMFYTSIALYSLNKIVNDSYPMKYLRSFILLISIFYIVTYILMTTEENMFDKNARPVIDAILTLPAFLLGTGLIFGIIFSPLFFLSLFVVYSLIAFYYSDTPRIFIFTILSIVMFIIASTNHFILPLKM